MQGKATIAGHPIHPLLITVPVGCFVAAAASDIVSIWAGPMFWSTMATWLLCFGVVSGLLAGIFGFVDYMTAPMSAVAKSLASWHMVLNLSMLVAFAVAFVMRLGNNTSVAGYVLEGLGLVILAASGVLGGQVAHGHLVGSSEEDLGARREAADVANLSPEERLVRERETMPPTRRGTV
jgi:uncharacterized membrane protein